MNKPVNQIYNQSDLKNQFVISLHKYNDFLQHDFSFMLKNIIHNLMNLKCCCLTISTLMF
jgi:hypothetical protein